MTTNGVSLERVHGFVSNVEAFANSDAAVWGAVSLATLVAGAAVRRWVWPAAKAVTLWIGAADAHKEAARTQALGVDLLHRFFYSSSR